MTRAGPWRMSLDRRDLCARREPEPPRILAPMAEAPATDNLTARLAQVRDGFKLLADYL